MHSPKGKQSLRSVRRRRPACERDSSISSAKTAVFHSSAPLAYQACRVGLIVRFSRFFSRLFPISISPVDIRYRFRITLAMSIAQCSAVRRCSSNDETHSGTTRHTVRYSYDTESWGADAFRCRNLQSSMPSMPIRNADISSDTRCIGTVPVSVIHPIDRGNCCSVSRKLEAWQELI